MSEKPVTVLAPAVPIAEVACLRWGQLYGSSTWPLALVETADALRGHCWVVVTATPGKRNVSPRSCVFFMGDQVLQVSVFPDWETLPYDLFSPPTRTSSPNGFAILSQLADLKRGILVVAAATLMQRLPPCQYVLGGSFDAQDRSTPRSGILAPAAWPRPATPASLK